MVADSTSFNVESTRSKTNDDPIEADLVEHNGRSRTLPSRQSSQHSIGMATTFEIDDDTDSRRKGFVPREDIGYVEMRPPKWTLMKTCLGQK